MNKERGTSNEKGVIRLIVNGKPYNLAVETAAAGTVPLSKNAYEIEIAKTLVKRALPACASQKV